MELTSESPLLNVHAFIISDHFNNPYKSIFRCFTNEIRKNYYHVHKLYALNNISSDIMITQIDKQKLNEILKKIDKNHRLKLRYINIDDCFYINI